MCRHGSSKNSETEKPHGIGVPKTPRTGRRLVPVLLTCLHSHSDDGSGVSTWLKTSAGGQWPSLGSLRHPRVNGQRQELRRVTCQCGDTEPRDPPPLGVEKSVYEKQNSQRKTTHVALDPSGCENCCQPYCQICQRL